MSVQIIRGDCRDVLKTLPGESAHCVVTSPPYFALRDYGCAGQIGLEETPAAFVLELTNVFREVRRVLRGDGTLWLNLGDSYAAGGHGGGGSFMEMRGEEGSRAWAHRQDKKGWRSPPRGLKPKDLCGIPWRVAFALQDDGWYLRQDIIWSKPNPMPESVTDRCTKAHEYLFLLSKSARYFYDAEAIKEESLSGDDRRPYAPGQVDRRGNGHDRGGGALRQGDAGTSRNKRSVWEVATAPFSEAHFATFPPALIEPCIKAGCPKGGTVLDPFGGAGTTGLVADRLQRNALLIELNPEYAAMAERRIHNDAPLFAEMEGGH